MDIEDANNPAQPEPLIPDLRNRSKMRQSENFRIFSEIKKNA